MASKHPLLMSDLEGGYEWIDRAEPNPRARPALRPPGPAVYIDPPFGTGQAFWRVLAVLAGHRSAALPGGPDPVS